MIAVSEAVRKVIEKTPFLAEALAEGVVNYSALARRLKKRVEEMTYKPASISSIVMALRRMPHKRVLAPARVFKKAPEMILRSGLMEVTVDNAVFSKVSWRILERLAEEKKGFLTITQGVFETTIIFSASLSGKIEEILGEEKILSSFTGLSSITIKLPRKVVFIPGVYHMLLRPLFLDGINVVEVVSTLHEFTIILEDKNVDRAFSVLKNYLHKGS